VLERHYRIHTRERLWECDEERCGKAFEDLVNPTFPGVS
jgi:hypothetical protein